MITRLLDRLPRIFFVVVPIAYIAFFITALPTNPQPATLYDLIYRFSIYVPYPVFVTIIFIGKIFLCRRSPDGYVAKWLVTVTYATGIFALTMWGILLIAIIGAFHIEVSIFDQDQVLRALASALVGGGMVGEGIAAFVIWHGFKTDTLGRRIRPWIL